MAHPFGDRPEVGKVDPSPVPMDASLPGLAISGAAVHVRNHDRHAPIEQVQQDREPEHRPRLAFRSTVDHEQSRPASRFAGRPPHVRRDRAFGSGDADRLGTLGIFGGGIACHQEPVRA